MATDTGDHQYDDQLPKVSLAAAEQSRKSNEQFLKRLLEIPRSEVSAERTNYLILQRILEDDLAEARYRAFLIPITNREGFHISFPELRRQMPLRTESDYRNYIARLRAFGQYARGHIELMRHGIREGRTLPSVVLDRYREPLEPQIVDDPRRSLFYEPLLAMPADWPATTRQQLQEEADEAIRVGIVDGYRAFLEFMEMEYVPAARGSIGASALPDGRAFYRHRIRMFTTLDLTPEQVHETGLAEVQRIRGEMQQILDELSFTGSIADFAESLRQDERFFAKTPDALLKEVALVLKRIDGRLPELFQTLPRTPYGVRPVPDYIAPQTSTAYYMPPPGDRSRAGFYYVNTFDLKSRPLYEIEALSLHEAVPGHHLQIALQQELEQLPPYRRFSTFTAYIEGWALYAERLGREVGFYEDPYSDFGRLTYEMWRACRLVVDTGLHYFGWSRQQAIDYLIENTALSRRNIQSEVDRYIAWPGQATAYKIGELKIRELRQEAEQRLGDRFDLRQFHDVLLLQGSVPLDLLSESIRQWIRDVEAATDPSPSAASGSSPTQGAT